MTIGPVDIEKSGRYYTFLSRLPYGEYFEIRPRSLPHHSKPIVDDKCGMCIGYSVTRTPGLWRIYDSDGIFVSMKEAPLTLLYWLSGGSVFFGQEERCCKAM